MNKVSLAEAGDGSPPFYIKIDVMKCLQSASRRTKEYNMRSIITLLRDSAVYVKLYARARMILSNHVPVTIRLLKKRGLLYTHPPDPYCSNKMT